MKSKLLLVAISLLILTACGATGGPDKAAARAEPKGDLAAYPVAPTSQTIDLRIDPASTDYSGSTRIALTITEPTDGFAFHAEAMSLDRVELSGPDGVVELTLDEREAGLIVAAAPTGMAAGDYILAIDFSNEYDRRAVGLYRMEQDGKGYLFTQFEAVDARKAFPCWDEPSFKIPYQLTLRTPAGQQAVSNTPVEAESTDDGWTTRVFARTRPLPSYLIAMAAGPLESVPMPGLSVPGKVYTVAGQSRLAALAVETTPPILAALEDYFGAAYPYAKLDLIAVPEYWPGAMENPGLVTYSDELLLVDAATASVGQQRRLAAVTAHELAHMWFGDLVTMKWWDDMWLNESFASWLGDKVTNEVYPQYKMNVASVRATNEAMLADARPSTKAIRKPVVSAAQIFEDLGLAYSKGQAVLEMVEQWIGPETFRAGIIDYLAAHAWGNAEAADLWGALSDASGMDVAAVMSGFIAQPGVPMLSVETSPDGKVTMMQQRFLNAGVEAADESWVIPVTFRYSAGGDSGVESVVVDGPTARAAVDGKLDWILPNVGARGYFRWQVPRDQLLALAHNAAAAMDARERIAFLGNAGALLDAGAIGGDDYLEILNAFADDPDPEVVSALFGGLSKVEAAFVPDDRRDAFAVYVRRTLRPALERFGLEHRDGEDETVSTFRPQLMSWLGGEGQDENVRRQADALAASYMEDPSSIDASLAGVALRIHAIPADRGLFQTYKRHFEEASSPRERRNYLGALGAFEDPEIQADALLYALEGPVRPTEMFGVLFGLPDTDAAADTVFRYVTDHYEAVSSRMPPDFRPMLIGVSGGCSPERLAAGRAFFLQEGVELEGTESQLAKVTDRVDDCVALRRREGEAVTAYLDSLGHEPS